MPISGLVTSVKLFDRPQGRTITSIEALVLGAMAAIIIAIAVPSYVAMNDRASDSTARAYLREAGDAADAYRADHGSYAGMSSVVLSNIDAELRPSSYRLETVRADGFCIESTVGGRAWHLAAPAQEVARGDCP